MFECFASMDVCVPHARSAHRDQKMVLEPEAEVTGGREPPLNLGSL